MRPVLLAFVVATATLIHAQDPPAGPPRFRVGVDAVRMDVVVTDENGRPVTDLTAEDFEVRQNGKRQQVTLARYVSVEAAAPRSALAPTSRPAFSSPKVGGATLSPSEVQRTIVFVVDDLGIAWENMEPTRRALRRFVAEHVQPRDLVALVKTSVNAGLAQQLTLDRRVLSAGIEEVKWSGFSRREVASFPALQAVAPPPSFGPPGSGAGPSAGPPGPGAPDRIDLLREEMSAAGTLSMLQMAIRGVQDLPGRKAVVLISEGFELFERDPDGTYQPTTLIRDRLDRLVDLAMRTGVVVYALDPRGLIATGLTAADNTAFMTAGELPPAAVSRRRFLLETQETLRYLADQTGGRAVINNNDLLLGLKTISDDMRGYYVVGYVPPDGTFAASGKTPRFHSVSVAVTRPGLRVRTRKGFLGVSDVDRPPPSATPGQALRDAAMSPFAVTDIPVRVTLLPGYDKKGAAFVRALLHISQAALTFTPEGTGRRVAKVDVFGMVFNEWGAPTTGRTAQFTVGLDGYTEPVTPQSGVVYSVVLPVPKPGGYQARFAVRDATSGALGAAGEFVDLPDVKKGQLVLSGVVLAAELSDAGTTEAADASVAGVSSPAIRVFEPGARLVFSYEIYNAVVPVDARVVIWRNGRPFFTAPPSVIVPPVKKQATKVAGGIKLGEKMSTGDYVFQVTATTRGQGKKPKTATRWTSFEVRNN